MDMYVCFCVCLYFVGVQSLGVVFFFVNMVFVFWMSFWFNIFDAPCVYVYIYKEKKGKGEGGVCGERDFFLFTSYIFIYNKWAFVWSPTLFMPTVCFV